MPRVCIVSEIFHPEDQGGQGRQAFALARQLIRQDVRVRVVTRRNFAGSSRHEAIDGIDITRLPPTGLLKGRGWAAIPRTLYFLIGLFWHLIRHRAEYDVLFVQGVKGVLIPTFAATALCGKRYVVKIDAMAELEHALTPESLARMGLSRTSHLARMWSGVRDMFLARAAAVVAISAEIESELRRRFGSALTIVRVPNGVALNPSALGRSKAQLRRDLALPDGDIVIYTGRLSRAKGLITLVQAWTQVARHHPQAHLVIVGSGDRSFDNCEAQLRSHVAKEGLQSQVLFTGHVADVTPYLAASDLFIQCSESEGFGMSLIEAMAAGLPSISTPVGIAPEVIVERRNGWLARIGDVQKVTAAIEQAFADRVRWGEMSRQARAAVASKFDFAAVAARYIELFKQLVRDSGGAGQWARWEPWLRRCGMFALALAAAFVLVRVAAFDWALQAVTAHLSPDGVITASGRIRFASLLTGSALSATVVGVLLLAVSRHDWRTALAAAFERDALAQRGLRVPNPYAVLLGSTGIALLVIALRTFRARLGEPVLFLFVKEGPFEQATFVLEFAAAVLCAGAAIRWRSNTSPQSLVIRGLYALCGFGLFVVAMEEINWGQTFFGFQTPESWAAINYQQETSLHNLIDRDALNWVSGIVAAAFGIGAMAMILWTRRTPRPVIAAIAPHTSLAPLVLVVVYAGARLHQEILELLLAWFFVFYSWRIYVAARSSADHRWQIVPPKSDVPLAHANRKWETELLEYTHDAIIIWEMDGGGILYWNRAAEQLYGHQRTEAIGRVTHELLQTQLTGGVSHLERTLARFGVWVGELRHRTRDGREVVVDARLAVLAQQSGRWLVLEVNRDLTDAKLAESQRDAAERQLTQWRGIYTGPLSSEQDRLAVLDGLLDDRGAVLQQEAAEGSGDRR